MPTVIRHDVRRAAAIARPAPWRDAGSIRILAALVLALALLLVVQPTAQAAELHLQRISPAGPPPAAYPAPNDKGQVFYLQRSANPNTVVYAAQFGADGTLNREDPLAAYWRRFNTNGEAKGLSMLERKFAYGIRTGGRPDGAYDVDFRAIPQIDVVLEQRAPGQAVLTFAPQGQPIDLTYGYLELDESGLMPEVTALRLFGQRRADGQRVQIDYGVSGGQIGG